MAGVALNYQPIIQTARVRTSKPNAAVLLDVARTTGTETCTGAEDMG